MLGSLIVVDTMVSQALMASIVTDWLSTLWPILLMIVGFSLVIFVHELGHFVMAKLCGVRVIKFAIGFGRELIGVTYGETRYAFNLLPLGGYVKMLGQEDFEIDKSGEWKVKDDPRSFTNKRVGRRMLIVSSGVVMNLIFAAFAFMVVFMVGFETTPPRVGYVIPGSAAHKAGLLSGDDILAVNGSKMDDFLDVKRAIMLADTDRPIRMRIKRQGRGGPFDVYIEPDWSEKEKARQIGIANPMTLQVGGMDTGIDGDEDREDRLKFGDFIVEVDGVKVQSYIDVKRLITDKRGKRVQILVDRPEDYTNPDSPTRRVVCYHRARMLVVSMSGRLVGQHILGLQPRTRLFRVESSGPAGKAGIRDGDIIVKWGDQWYPTVDECRNMLGQRDDGGRYVHAGRDLEIIVRRIGMSKEIGTGPDRPTGTLVNYRILAPLLEQRDDLMMLAHKDPAAARERILAVLGEQTKDEVLLSDVRADLETTGISARGLVRWLGDLDLESFVIRPKGSGLWGSGEPGTKVRFGLLETDRLIVGKVVEKDLEGHPTPVAGLNLPRGALITHVNDTKVKTWLELVEILRTRAGQEITLTHTHEGVTASGKIKIPRSLKTTLDLPPEAAVIRIDGKKRSKIKQGGRTLSVALPYWGAAYGILKANIGKTVPVVYRYAGKEVSTDPAGKPLTYAVTADNYNPWMMRIIHTPLLLHFPERVTLRKRNPVAAMWMGFKKTYNFIMQAYKMLEHMIITQKVGVENISGPVGILRIGHQVAQSGLTNLLYFLAFISANLAVINFLPLPIVDGGLMVFLILEKIRGRPVSIKMQVVTQLIGLVLIIGIFVFVTFMDVSKWVGEG